MDYIYAFRQVQRDRLEDAGLVQYPRENSLLSARRNRAIRPRLAALMLALSHLLVR